MARLLLIFTLILLAACGGSNVPGGQSVPPGGPLLQRHLCVYYTFYSYPCYSGTCTDLQPNPAWYLTFENSGRYTVTLDETNSEGGNYTWDEQTLEVLFLSGPFQDAFDARLGRDNDTVFLKSLEYEIEYECYPEETES